MNKNKIINCPDVAQQIYSTISKEITILHNKGIIPRFATVLVGEDPSSLIYVHNKQKKAETLGLLNTLHKLPKETKEDALISLIESLNNDSTIHGILVQMPLPKHINSEKILLSINPNKDIDGLCPFNQGMLQLEKNKGILEEQHKYKGFIPCTPMGCISILRNIKIELAGKHAVVLGRSNLVGIPMAQLLLNNDCTVTIAHSKSSNIKELTKNADILIVAIGRNELIDSSYIKEGAIIIDVGINKVDSRIVGDVNTLNVLNKVSLITPVPKGVGPLTIASLMFNVVKAAGRC